VGLGVSSGLVLLRCGAAENTTAIWGGGGGGWERIIRVKNRERRKEKIIGGEENHLGLDKEYLKEMTNMRRDRGYKVRGESLCKGTDGGRITSPKEVMEKSANAKIFEKDVKRNQGRRKRSGI